MADPLSVAASVVGLVTAGVQITKVLTKVIKQARDAPVECHRIADEISGIQSVLNQLQLFIIGTNRATRSRTSLILVEQVVVTLAACVTTFSELDTFAHQLESEADMGILDRLRWTSKEKDIRDVLQRLDSHKSSLTLMMTILTCQKQDDAEDKVDMLCDLVHKFLEEHSFLRHRLTTLELHQLGHTSPVDPTRPSQDGFRGAIPLGNMGQQPPDGVRVFAFEEVLNTSRPYRNAIRDADDGFSIVSTAGRTGSWSMLSGLSLSEVSRIAILAIPIYPGDISNTDAYDFESTDDDTLSMMTEKRFSLSSSPQNGQEKSTRTWLKKLIRGPKTPQIPLAEPPKVVFGVPLEQSLEYANVEILRPTDDGQTESYGFIPIIIAKPGVFLKQNGSRTPDIFAQSGHPKRIAELQDIFDSPPDYGKGLVWAGWTVYDAASIVLRYLKSLPEPVVPYDHFDRFIAVLEPYTRGDMKTPLREEDQACLLEGLPGLNRFLLAYLVDLMAVFASLAAVNNMTADRLVATFQPSILSGPPAAMDEEATLLAAKVVAFLVENEDVVF